MEIEVRVSKSLENVRLAETAFADWSGVDKTSLTFIVLPTLYDPLEGLKPSVAAKTVFENNKKRETKRKDKNKIILALDFFADKNMHIL